MKSVLMAIFLLFVCLPTWSVAAEGCRGGDCTTCHTLTVKEAGELLKDVGTVSEVSLSPVKGLWQITLEREGRKGIAFMNYGKSYVLPGPLFPLTQAKNQAGSSVSPQTSGVK